MRDDHDVDRPQQKPSLLQIICSTLAAAIGIQNTKNHARDFSGGNMYAYLVAGAVFTFIFIMAIVLIVKLVLANT